MTICLCSRASSWSAGLTSRRHRTASYGTPSEVNDGVVEAALPHQQLVHSLEEQAGLGALDDAVVVGRRDRDDLRHAQIGERALVGRLVLGREVDRADPDDDALPRHQPRHGLHGADRARVGQRDRRALEVVGAQLVRADLADQVLVRGDELGERHLLGRLHDGHDQRVAAVGLLDVDGEAEVDVLVVDDPRLAVGTLDEGRVHDAHVVGDRADDRVADQVGEAHLSAAGAREVPVDHAAVDLEQLGGDDAEAGRRRDAEAAPPCSTRSRRPRRGSGRRARRRRRRPARGRCGRRGRGGSGCGCGRGRRSGRRRHDDRTRPVVREELAPRLTHRRRVRAVLLVHLVDEPRVRSELVGARLLRVRVSHVSMLPVGPEQPEWPVGFPAVKRVLLALVPALVLTGALAACGGDDSGGSTATPAAARPRTKWRRARRSPEIAGARAVTAATASKGTGPTWKGLYGSEVELTDGTTVTVDEPLHQGVDHRPEREDRRRLRQRDAAVQPHAERAGPDHRLHQVARLASRPGSRGEEDLPHQPEDRPQHEARDQHVAHGLVGPVERRLLRRLEPAADDAEGSSARAPPRMIDGDDPVSASGAAARRVDS